MEEKKAFYVAQCGMCGQDWVYILITPKKDKLYLQCPECTLQWDPPADLEKFSNSRITVSDLTIENGAYANEEQVESFGWKKYVIGASPLDENGKIIHLRLT